MDKLTERITTLEERLRALKAQQTRSVARQRTVSSRRERKDDTRRKILAGAWVLNQVERGQMSSETFKAALDRFLTRPEDRALFDLPASAPAQPAGQPAGAEEPKPSAPVTRSAASR